MLANEALEVLALRPGATPLQIKEAYRDLVKVWHPDRFGSDARLRRKADEKLQQINEAYRVLQSGGGSTAVYRAASTPRSSSAAGASSAPVAAKGRGRPNRVAMGWFYGFLVISLMVFAGHMVMEHASTRAQVATPTSVQVASGPAVTPTPDGGAGGRGSHPAGAKVAPFAVRSLSEAETARLEEACEPQRERLGQVAYQVCISAQVGLMTNPAGLPYLGALNAAERESIKSACAEARRAGGEAGYGRCLTAKMAEWAAEPARPKLSTLNDNDKAAAELACQVAKEREGPAAYDRCLVRFMRALMEGR